MDFWLDAINTSKWNFPTLLRICDIAQRNKKMCFIRSSIEYHPHLLLLNSMISLQYYFSGLIIYGSYPHKLFFIKGNINRWLKNYTKIDLTYKQQRPERTCDTADIGPMKEQSLVTFTQASFRFRAGILNWNENSCVCKWIAIDSFLSEIVWNISVQKRCWLSRSFEWSHNEIAPRRTCSKARVCGKIIFQRKKTVQDSRHFLKPDTSMTTDIVPKMIDE